MPEQTRRQNESSLVGTTRPRLPLPVATGGIGLFVAAVSPGGLSGGAGFLIGFFVGLLFPALIVVISSKDKVSAPTNLPSNKELSLGRR